MCCYPLNLLAVVILIIVRSFDLVGIHCSGPGYIMEKVFVIFNTDNRLEVIHQKRGVLIFEGV